MVEDRITDGKRIAQLLASDLTGLETGPLAALSLEGADPDAEPTSSGTFAYALAVEGEGVGTVTMYPDHVVVEFSVSVSTVPDDGTPAAERDPRRQSPAEEGETERRRLTVESGADVKRAVDAVREALRGVADG